VSDPYLVRQIEAVLFAAAEPVMLSALVQRFGDATTVHAALMQLVADYAPRGVTLVERGGGWMFQTAPDLGHLLRQEVEEARRLSRAGVETLAIIAYHQPVTRAEIEEIRGVSVSKGTLDLLMDAGWVRIAGRRESPGRPVTFATTQAFLTHFGLSTLKDLPGIEELRAAGLLDLSTVAFAGNMPAGEDVDEES